MDGGIESRANRRAGPTSASVGASVRSVRVWDLPTRLFHWLLVAFVALAWAIVGEDGWKLTIHEFAGYGVLVALVFRLGWGFVGSTHARFSDFVRSWPVVRDYTRQLARQAPPRYVGHNPLGGWMIVLLIVTLAAIVVSGLFAGDKGGQPLGALAYLIAPDIARAAKEIHESLFGFLQVLVVVHLAGVFTDWLLTAENLVGAMLTGDKELTGQEVGREGNIAPSWRAVVVVGVAIAVVWAVVTL